jgi:signal transduction histidine kinase
MAMSTEAPSRPQALLAFEVAVIALAVGGIALILPAEPDDHSLLVLLWAVLIALVEFMPVPAWRGMTISVGFPLLIAVAIIYFPGTAGLITFLGMADPRELRREVRLSTALFNRAQVALSVMAASSVFHMVADINTSEVWELVLGASLASVADYLANVALVTVYMSFRSGLIPRQVLKELRVGDLREFLVSYLGLGLLGLTLAKFFVAPGVGAWAIPAFLAPLLFARQAFFRARALEEAHDELKEREAILRDLSNAMAEERADERLQIAGYLHDDLAQVLFRLSLQVDVARKLLEKNDLDELESQLLKIRDSKQETSDRIRALIRDLHRSPLGAKGLSEAIESFVDETGHDSNMVFHRDVEEIALPAPIALLLYHVAREGVMNAMKHAGATDMWISVGEDGEDIYLELRDNGVGFDTSAPGPEGHYGMAMMRERAKIGGGTFDVVSAPGKGTRITVRFPTSLLQRDQGPGTEPAAASGTGHASPGTTGTTSRGAADSRDSVPA